MKNEDDKSKRKTWDLMIGICLVLLGGLRLYNSIQTQTLLSFKGILILIFIIFGGYLIFRHFQNSTKG